MKTALVIMAAGIGSRYGGGIKQLETVGPSGEIIMDYSIYDAVEAGFDKIVFIIRRDLEKDFKEVIGDRIEAVLAKKNIEVAYAFQELKEVPEGVKIPDGRTKPWGTGHAILACKGIVQEPFAVINADDYYGKEAFVKLHDFLQGYTPEKANQFCMAGFILKNTLSDFGTVTRGICKVNEDDYLVEVDETKNIMKTATGASCPKGDIDPESYVSMNMWGLTPEFIDTLETGFVKFFETLEDELGGEYLLPIYIDELLKKDQVSVKLLETKDIWVGVTYKEDKPVVVEHFKQMIEAGIYSKELFAEEK